MDGFVASFLAACGNHWSVFGSENWLVVIATTTTVEGELNGLTEAMLRTMGWGCIRLYRLMVD
jgi:hypothetical protein|eukprot:scaffold7854_cov108-Alexandrium_tamarense.AAC.18